MNETSLAQMIDELFVCADCDQALDIEHTIGFDDQAGSEVVVFLCKWCTNRVI